MPFRELCVGSCLDIVPETILSRRQVAAFIIASPKRRLLLALPSHGESQRHFVPSVASTWHRFAAACASMVVSPNQQTGRSSAMAAVITHDPREVSVHTAFDSAQRILRDRELEQELAQFLHDDATPRALVEGSRTADDRFDAAGLEAIVQRFGRPSLLTWNGQYDPPRSAVWRDRLAPFANTIQHTARSVGRVEVRGLAGSHVGTAWMIGDEIAITNRHVALIFAARGNGVFPMLRGANGQALDVFVDFLAERDNPNSHDVRVDEVLFIANDGPHEPDLAFLRLAPRDRPMPPALTLASTQPTPGQMVVNLGYPAFDSRNDAADQQRIFNGVYNVKRMAPGEVMGLVGDAQFTHDCATLGGCSGAAMLDPDTGLVVGLHFAGREAEANWAVAAPVVEAYFDRHVRGTGSFVPRFEAPHRWADDAERGRWTEDLASRTGYDPAFLGPERLTVPLPTPLDPSTSLTVGGASDSPAERNVVAGNARDDELRYTHFSVIMHADRRLALLTAVNIDGGTWKRHKRAGDPWRLDPRIDAEQQLDNRIYRRNPLDRGHLVRRLDPTWGTDAEQAERDTFFWTNCAPQHGHLNQRVWLGLEDHILNAAHTHGFRATVFTGPLFANDDPVYRGTQLPQAFWKVVVMAVEENDGPRLRATAYVLSQAHWVSDVEFALGAYGTYQVPIRRLARLSAIDFGDLGSHDPMAEVESSTARPINTLDDLVF